MGCGKNGEVKQQVGFRCEKCWFKKIAYTTTKSIKNWEAIRDLYKRQKGLCAYTGIKLVLGENTNLDHITPVKKGGTHKINNLQWVDGKVNWMKYDSKEAEFLKTIKLILKRKGYCMKKKTGGREINAYHNL